MRYHNPGAKWVAAFVTTEATATPVGGDSGGNESCSKVGHSTHTCFERLIMLDELGTTPDAVADTLRARGIQGVRNTVRILNPIVRYVTSQYPDARAVDLILVDRLRIVFASGEPTEVPVPEAVLRFLEMFHRGAYPELEMPIDPG
jgi:hypothetical protein